MKTISTHVAKITANPLGSIVGGIAGFYAAKKIGKVTNVWLLTGIAALGVIAGAMVQSNVKAKASTPTPATIK